MVQPGVCLISWTVCSRSKRRRYACQSRSTSAGAAPVCEGHTPHRLGIPVAGRVVDPQPDQGVLQDG
ncbi:hypothetical protein TR74_01580 [Carbonactinospora thermoautotrophica]|uniref:Uncharacterized protein n=1 Tax=Carbonactinospora thermoautotrophica TaxID=1469144 RepID=A0A132NLZ4_9ACTN|nr:hypothetical protein TR74_01580 [Carbonactinospora thermoautotrophica]